MSVTGPASRSQTGETVDWAIRIEETRVGLTDDGAFVVVLRHVRNRGSNADWRGSISQAGSGGTTVYRDSAPDAETLMIRCKQWIAEHDAIKERDPTASAANERDPVSYRAPDGT